MACKRKQSHAQGYPDNYSKRKKLNQYAVLSSSSDAEDSDLGEGEWLIKCIIDENQSHYFIDWEGPWSPTWENGVPLVDVRANHLDCKEPKENANDLAVQVWEEKKRSDIARKEREIKDLKLLSSASTSIAKSIETGYCDIHFAPSSTSDSRSSRNIEAASEASPPEDNVSRPAAAKDINRNSSLFFTPESEVGSQQQGGEDEAPREIPETQLVDSTVPAPSLPYLSQAFLYGEIPYNSQPFEYFRGSSIPSEYKLPEEVEPVIKKESSPTPFSTDSDATDSSDWSFNSADEVKYWKDFDTEQEEPAVDEVAETQIAEQPPEPQNSVFPLTDSGQRALSQLENKMDKKSPRKPLSYDEIMEKYRDVPGSTPTEKLRNSHAEMRARILDSFGTIRASARLSESPIRASSAEITQSLGGADKAPAPPSQMNPVPEPLSHPAELPSPKHEEGPVQTIQPSALTVTYTEPPPGSVQLGPSEYAISLPMDSRVKDDYESVLGHEARTIVDFLSGFDPHSKLPEDEDKQLHSKMNEVLEQLSSITTHPDLNMIEHIRYSQSDLEQEASWGEYSSSKFLLLGYLLQLASGRDLHFVIMVQGPKLLEILERFLLGKGLTYTRPRYEMGPGTDLEVSMVKDSLSFGIQTTRSEGIVRTYKPPSMIIALDRSFTAQTPTVEHMRTAFARNGNLLPVVRLLVSNSSEHIERCLPDVSPLQRLRLLIYHTKYYLGVVGELQDDALNVHEDVEEILACLSSDNFDVHWSLPMVEPLQIADPDELDSMMGYGQANVNPDNMQLPEHMAQKRSFQVEETIEQGPKRQRTVTTQFTQSTESSNMTRQELETDLEESETKLKQMKASYAAELDQLRETLSTTESRLRQNDKILEDLQHRYETRTKNMHQLRQERDNLDSTKGSLEQRVERQRDEITKLKDERTELKRELQQARETIKNGGGSAAELETANEEIRRLTKENASLERKAEYEKNQSEYTREQYQNASTVAAQSGNEIRQLKSENEDLKRKVAGEASRVRELNMRNDENTHLTRVQELELTLANRDDLLRRKEDELREIRKNRPSTRSTSAPRSPKLSANANSRPSSPGLNNNNNGSNSIGRASALRFSSEMY